MLLLRRLIANTIDLSAKWLSWRTAALGIIISVALTFVALISGGPLVAVPDLVWSPRLFEFCIVNLVFHALTAFIAIFALKLSFRGHAGAALGLAGLNIVTALFLAGMFVWIAFSIVGQRISVLTVERLNGALRLVFTRSIRVSPLYSYGIGWDLRLPAYTTPLLAVLGAALTVLWIVWGRRRFHRPMYACPACGYDLRGTPSSACPECGQPPEAQHTRA